MSKAFTRESDDAPDLPAVERRGSAVPPGVKNYMTPDGAQRMQDELSRLLDLERQESGASSEDEVRKREKLLLKQRIAQLQQILASAVVVPIPSDSDGSIRFGASVTVRNAQGEETFYRIVGADEMDIDRNWVSWLSPIAKALLKAKLGDRIRFRFPAGEETLEIVKVVYE